MAEEAKKVEVEVAPPPAPEPTKDIAEEKTVVPAPEDSKALVVVESKPPVHPSLLMSN